MHILVLPSLVALTLLMSTQAQAQMASASLFPDMKSINPAVINKRTGELITATVKGDRIKKDQSLDTARGASVTGASETNIDVNTVSLFRGGKGGGSVTTELGVDYNMGSRADKLSSTTESKTAKTDANNTLIYGGLGFLKVLGASAGHADYKSKDDFSDTFGGQSISLNIEMDVKSTDYRVGYSDKFGGLDIGLVYLHNKTDFKMGGAMAASGTGPKNSTDDVAGVAVGYSTRTFHIEIGAERNLKERDDNFLNKKLRPSRYSGTIEGQFGPLLIGYTGRYYVDGFLEIERVLYNQFVYQTTYNEPRLDNIINFSLGRDKGSVFSASIFYSVLEVDETSFFFLTAPKVSTKTTAMGASVKYSYSF